jgi:D-Tyr-tRNAtyr deacylase
VPDIDGAYIEFPYDIKKEFGKGRVKVRARFDGEIYDGSIVNMGVKHDDGSICYIIGIPKAIRLKINKQAGEKIQVSVCAR